MTLEEFIERVKHLQLAFFGKSMDISEEDLNHVKSLNGLQRMDVFQKTIINYSVLLRINSKLPKELDPESMSKISAIIEEFLNKNSNKQE